ncbi:hypothetical protein AFLA70_261g001451 [Aspergillus flavus AF70]|nr:hypothetical protein AFLA70_261g001451 [Aspergillus flavus AF70]
MDEYCSLYKEIQSLTALTSLIFQRPPDGIDYGEFGKEKSPPKEPEQGTDEELDKLPDETDFEDDVTTGDSTTTLILLKQRSLDRLAEVLARFKTQKTGRHGRGKKKDAHLDAKHVTSVAMVENSTLQRVTFLCSKNEGLKGEDEVFLERLCELLTSILKNGQRQTCQSEVFDLIFEHNTPRVEYYSGVIQDAFKRASGLKVPDTLTEDTIKDMVDQKLEARLWEGLIINIDGRQREGSQELPDCLSDKDLDKAVIETTRNNELRDFLESFYAIIRNPRQRPALKNLLKQALHGSEKLFTKAWDALLFLARTFHAAVTLVELASKLKLKLFNSFRFVPVSACMFKTKTYAPLGKELPLKVLEALPCQPEGNGWVKLLQDQRTINEYTNILRLPRSIHAEVQLMGYLETSLSKNNDQRAMMSENPETIRKSLLDLFADDYSCRTFGFNNCTSTREALCLVCLYDTMIAACRFPARVLNNYLKDGLLGEALLFFCRLRIEQTGGQLECECIAWYLERRKIGPFPIPNLEGEMYSIWETAYDEALNSLDLYDRFNDGCRLNTAQAEVFKLFVTLRGSICQIPDTNSSTWINFGFCYCTSFQQRQELSLKYLLLAASNASFDDIVSAYETTTMAELMTKHGIDLSDLSQKGVRLQRPSGMVYSVFRLMIGVSHALSGRFCSCFRMQPDRPCHHYFEPHFDSECDVAYGFHLTNSWERWQLLNFYRHLFNLPEFDPRAMAAAKESPQRGALGRYIDTLVPDMRIRIFDMDRAGSILFPNFDAGISVTIQGESEFRCALCGTSFNIARIRTINEPFSAAWSNEDPRHFVCALDEDDDKNYGDCSTAETGCAWAIRKCEDIRTGTDEQDAPEYRYLFFDMVDGQLPTVGQAVPMGEPLEEKAGRFGVRRVHLEHIAGPGCCSTLGYSGADISLEEMQGCQTGQGLVHNDSGDEEPSPDDLECEINSDYFLSGLVDCMPFPEVGGAGVSPARHQYDWIEPADPFDDWFEPYMAVPFHPWCFGVYMKLCKLRLGHVEINKLVDYFDNIESYPLQYREEPDPAVQKAADENWVHISGDEWLAANPFYVPKLREILGRAMDTGPSFSPQDGAFEPLISMDKNTSDPFAGLPQEILDMIIDNLSTKDIASLRLVSRKFYQLHVSLWYRLIQEDMPWLWEVWSDEKPYFWATVTEGDIQQNKGETRIEFGEEKIMTHTINVDEHLAKWTMPIPAPRRTNWFLLYTDVKRHWSKLRGLWNRRRIWNYQQGLIASLKMHILSSDDHTA